MSGLGLSATRADWELARATHRDFARRPGARHIAGEAALAYLCALLRTRKPASVLEFGAGIGTITRLLLTHPAGVERVVSTEDHPFCLEQLARNVPGELRRRLELIAKLEDLGALRDGFDLVILDGEFGSADRLRFLREGTLCFVEGGRASTRAALDAALAARGLACPLHPYGQRRRPVALAWKRLGESALRYPRLQLNKRLKGCWAGEVARIDAAASGSA